MTMSPFNRRTGTLQRLAQGVALVCLLSGTSWPAHANGLRGTSDGAPVQPSLPASRPSPARSTFRLGDL